MSQNRGQVDSGGNNVQKQGPGDMIMDQKKITADTTAGNATLTPAQIFSGIILRTGPAGAYADIFPSAAQLLAANPQLGQGDAFEFLIINGVAQAGTPTGADAGVTMTSTGLTASLTKRYMCTILSAGLAGIFAGAQVNASPNLQLTPEQVKTLAVGMLVTGTNIPGASFITGINYTTGVVTINQNATATIPLNALTFLPRVEYTGLYQAAR